MSDVNSGAASAAPAEVPSPLAGLGIVAVVASTGCATAVNVGRLYVWPDCEKDPDERPSVTTAA